MKTSINTGACCVQPEPIKKAGTLRRIVQKYNPLPITNARVRFDVGRGMWALTANDKITQHFDLAVMKNVRFEKKSVTLHVGCSGTETTVVGYAIGDLYLHKSSSRVDGRNFSFNGQDFVRQDKSVMTTAQEIALFPNRRAVMFQ